VALQQHPGQLNTLVSSGFIVHFWLEQWWLRGRLCDSPKFTAACNHLGIFIESIEGRKAVALISPQRSIAVVLDWYMFQGREGEHGPNLRMHMMHPLQGSFPPLTCGDMECNCATRL
jgi:hypothetical protein